MVLLEILSDSAPASRHRVGRFPFVVGRSSHADLSLPADGVWDQHLEFGFDRKAGFSLKSNPQAISTVNGQLFQETLLRNGDLIQIGSIKIRFWLAEAAQRAFERRELATWISLFVLVLTEVLLMLFLD